MYSTSATIHHAMLGRVSDTYDYSIRLTQADISCNRATQAICMIQLPQLTSKEALNQHQEENKEDDHAEDHTPAVEAPRLVVGL
jgi:hypothetical protein